MNNDTPTKRELLLEMEGLKARLGEAEETLRAIRSGETDAIVISGPQGNRVFTLEGADQSYRTLVETMNEGTVTLLPEGTIAYSNSSFAEIVRTPLEQVIGSLFVRYLATNQEPRLNSFLKQNGTCGSKMEFTLVAAGGNLVPAQISARPLEGGRPGAFCLVITDLSELKAAARARSFLAAIVESSQDAIIGKTLDGIVVSWNRGAESLFGYVAGEMVRRPVAVLVPADRVSETEMILHSIRAGKYVENYETQRVTKKGQLIDVSLSVSPIRDAEDHLTGASTIIRDITERKRGEEKLRRLNRALKTVSECNQAIVKAEDEPSLLRSICGILVVEGGYQLVWVGFAEQDEGRTLRLVAHEGSGGEYLTRAPLTWGGDHEREDPVARAVRTGEVCVGRSSTADLATGASEPACLRCGYPACISVPLVQGGRPFGVLNLCSSTVDAFDVQEVNLLKELANDLSFAIQALRERKERRRAEEEVRRLNAELEFRVQRRTAELQAANRELEAFSYSVSHDLRAPLRAIDGFSLILMEEFAPQLPAEAQKHLARVRAGAVHMGHLIDDLLALSRLGRQELKRRRVVVTDIVQQSMEDLRADWEGREVEFIIGDLPACEADSLLLRQVFVNLLSNALKFTRRQEKARIEIGAGKVGELYRDVTDSNPHRTSVEMLGPDSSIYYVRDNGVGFDMRYADKLFGVFKRLHRQEDFEGTGVGLATVQRIVHKHGGHVWAEAELGKGATFYFTIGESLRAVSLSTSKAAA